MYMKKIKFEQRPTSRERKRNRHLDSCKCNRSCLIPLAPIDFSFFFPSLHKF